MGTMVTELCDMAASLGDFAETMKKHGHKLSEVQDGVDFTHDCLTDIVDYLILLNRETAALKEAK